MGTVRSTPRVGAPDARTPGRRRPAGAADRPRMPKANPWPGRPGEWPTHCPLCFGALEPLPGAGGYARHRSARCSAQCVLTTRQYQPEDLTIRGSRDAQVAARHRERFVAHWARHYALMRRAWPALTIGRFIAVIACVDVADLWSYRMLRDDDLAAVLLVLAGFLRVPDASGADVSGTDASGADASGVDARAPGVRWVRFWFDASVRDVGDLWAAGNGAPSLFRVDYREPLVTPYPTGAQVQAWQPVDGMRDAWAQRVDTQEPAVDDADRAAFARFLARTSVPGANV
ncbi:MULTISPECIES: hypothetical protein [Burkholderia]|uniref:Uncharacterized protein n=1 Tax=Burkholderia cepacia TaxID=292 RepID=A0A8E1VDA3_BURCE|nr:MULTISPECIES: hypothetical protein [Burkholderia]KML10934.1 hypothetical protein VL00_21955 [Burkholderia cepacia]KML42514.1 hypothetical protein VL13_10470 [Burkholderia lata]KMN53439.1 hypothetical protein VK92_29095 [Burkholderia sp. LK4]KWF76677.1 hypothetical protein WL94_34505 [Burkholderia cepacia]MBA9897231.1 hypothetical protein [Burkholderia cepacia]